MGSEEGGTARALCFEGELVLTMRKRGRHWFLSNAALAPAVIDRHVSAPCSDSAYMPLLSILFPPDDKTRRVLDAGARFDAKENPRESQN